jgi:hypothetical protein
MKASNGHCCRMCGTSLQPRRTRSGKYLGSMYYTTLCDECLPKHRAEHAKRNANYDKFRKHWTRKCKVCGKVFDVKGNTNSGTLKTCSKECENTLHHNNALLHNYGETVLGPNRYKVWIKLFEVPQTKDSLRLGPTHHKSLQVTLMSPDGDVYHVCNVMHFIRTHEHLFCNSDIEWVPSKTSSRVDAVGRRPSLAVGCLTCHASSGLYTVTSGRRRTWKGWSKV